MKTFIVTIITIILLTGSFSVLAKNETTDSKFEKLEKSKEMISDINMEPFTIENEEVSTEPKIENKNSVTIKNQTSPHDENLIRVKKLIPEKEKYKYYINNFGTYLNKENNTFYISVIKIEKSEILPVVFKFDEKKQVWEKVEGKIQNPFKTSIFNEFFNYFATEGNLMINIITDNKNKKSILYSSIDGGETWVGSRPFFLHDNMRHISMTSSYGKIFVSVIHPVTGLLDIYSTSDGNNWSIIFVERKAFIENWFSLASNKNHLYFFGSSQNNGNEQPTLLTYSFDDDRTIISNVCGESFINHSIINSSIAIDENKIYILYTYFYPSTDFKIKFASSINNGFTWDSCIDTQPGIFFISKPSTLKQKGSKLFYLIGAGALEENNLQIVESNDYGKNWNEKKTIYRNESIKIYSEPEIWLNNEKNQYFFAFKGLEKDFINENIYIAY